MPVVEVPEIISDATMVPEPAEPTASSSERSGGDGSEDNLKENWLRALYWTGYISGSNLEVDLWFARVVEKLRADPYLDSCELEIDQSPLGQYLPGASMNSLDLAILMGDLAMVRKILRRSWTYPDNVLCGPIQDLSKNRKFLQSTPIFDADTETGILYTPLHLAVEGGNSDIVVALLTNGADVNALNWQGQSPMDLACKGENFSMLEQLLAYDREEKKGPFHVAVGLGNVDLLKKLPFENVHAVDRQEMTPLHLAVECGNRDIIDALLERGSDFNAPNGVGQTPLDLACNKRNVDLLERLLAKDDKEGRKPIHVAVRHGDVKFMKRLTSLDVNVNAIDFHGKTPLHHLATKHFHSSHITKIVKVLARDKLLDMKALDSSGLSAFYVAVLYCNTQFVIALLDSFKDQIRLNEVCIEDLGPPIQIAFERGDKFREIERVLRQNNRVKDYIESLYRDRQIYVDATNAILVGAALIASVTFASWLQPPLNYTSYSGEGYSNSSSPNFNYVDVEHNIALRAFWVFNALSFYFAIATVVCGARSVVPRSHLFIIKTVKKLRTNLLWTSILLVLSVLCVIIAFAIAGTIVLTPLVQYQWCMIVPTIVGGMVCIISLVYWIKNMVENNFNTSSNSKRSYEKEINNLQGRGYNLE